MVWRAIPWGIPQLFNRLIHNPPSMPLVFYSIAILAVFAVVVVTIALILQYVFRRS